MYIAIEVPALRIGWVAIISDLVGRQESAHVAGIVPGAEIIVACFGIPHLAGEVLLRDVRIGTGAALAVAIRVAETSQRSSAGQGKIDSARAQAGGPGLGLHFFTNCAPGPSPLGTGGTIFVVRPG